MVQSFSDENLTFEAAYARLEEVLSRLQIGNMTLDESLAAYEEGMALAAHCQGLLDAAELRIETLDRQPETFADDEDEEPPF